MLLSRLKELGQTGVLLQTTSVSSKITLESKRIHDKDFRHSAPASGNFILAATFLRLLYTMLEYPKSNYQGGGGGPVSCIPSAAPKVGWRRRCRRHSTKYPIAKWHLTDIPLTSIPPRKSASCNIWVPPKRRLYLLGRYDQTAGSDSDDSNHFNLASLNHFHHFARHGNRR